MTILGRFNVRLNRGGNFWELVELLPIHLYNIDHFLIFWSFETENAGLSGDVGFVTLSMNVHEWTTCTLVTLSMNAHELTTLATISMNVHELTTLVTLSMNAHELTTLVTNSMNAHELTTLVTVSMNAHELTTLVTFP